ncbi:MAG: transglutaminase-like putative cysteine protease/tetratricopeptide (TPR) repeat protein [Flavobacteriales bacterium]
MMRIPPNRLGAVFAAVIALLIPLAASADGVEAERFDERIATAVSADSPEVEIAAFFDAQHVSRWLPVERVIAAYLSSAERVGSVEVAAVMRYGAARELIHTGQVDAANTMLREIGFFWNWSMLGPLPGDGSAPLETPMAAELQGVDASALVDSRIGSLRWRELADASTTGYLDLGDVLPTSTDAVTYLSTTFDVPVSLNATLGLAADGSYRVWLNGAPLIEQRDHLGGFAVRDTYPVQLVAGENTVLIKLVNDDTAYGLHASLWDSSGAAVGANFRATMTAPPVDGGDFDTPFTWADRFTADGARARVAAAVALTALQPADPSEPWRGRLDGVDAETLGADASAWLARAAGEHWRTMDVLTQALLRHPEDVWLRLEWVSERLREEGVQATLDGAAALNELLLRDDPPAMATVSRSWLLSDNGFPMLAWQELSALDERLNNPRALDRALLTAARRSAPDRQVALLERYVEREQTDLVPRARLAYFYRAQGEMEASRALLGATRELLPLSARAAVSRANALRSDGDSDGAWEELSSAVHRNPGNPTLLRRIAEFHVDLGELDAAADALEEILATNPHDAGTRAYLDDIRPPTEAFYDFWRESVDEVMSMTTASSQSEVDVLLEQRVIRVRPGGLSETWVQMAWAINSRSGAESLRSLPLSYTPDSEQVRVLGVTVVKANGQRLESYDSADYGPPSGPAAMYFDVHTRQLTFNQLEPGDVLIVEYTIEDVTSRNIFDDYFGIVLPLQSRWPTAFTRFVIQRPAERELYDNRADVTVATFYEEELGDERFLVVEAGPRDGLPIESNAPGVSEWSEYVSISTVQEWDALADWYWGLIESQLVTSPEIERTVQELISGAETERERVAEIYRYVVRNTRYVGLEFGVHGYKPYRTTECFSRRFGDCKDTASLLKVMLQLAGVHAEIVLLRTSDRGRVVGTPPSLAYFNHAIAYVPSLDLYLDGTAGFSGSGELPAGDQSASALLVHDGAGGTFLTTPVLPSAQTVAYTELTVHLGDAPSGTAVLEYSGGFAPGARRRYESNPSDTEGLQDELNNNIPGVTVDSVSMNDLTDTESSVRIEAVLSGGRWWSQAGEVVTLNARGYQSNLLTRLAGAETRDMPARFAQHYELRDRAVFSLPPAWTVMSLPESRSAESRFGTWSVSVSLTGDELVAESHFALQTTWVTRADYPEFRAFVAEAQRALEQIARFAVGGGQ